MKEYLKEWIKPTSPPRPGDCLIWNEGLATITELWEPTGSGWRVLRGHRVDSDRAGGSYLLWQKTKPLVESLSEQQKARLTTWLIVQRDQGNSVPTITEAGIDYAKSKPNLPPHERAEKLLRYLASQIDTIEAGTSVNQETLAAYAWSESTNWEEVVYLLNYLRDNGWLVDTGTNNRIFKDSGLVIGVITVAGHTHIADRLTNADSTQAFVAIWFDPEVDFVYDQGIAPAVESAGFKPYRADREHYLSKIDDQVIAEIRRSRFLIADMTHGNKGARGSVYFEAGFAFGLGIPVIYSCRNDMFEDLHFDTRQYPHIEWSKNDIETFSQNLENRIRALIT